MTEPRWTVRFTREEVATPSAPMSFTKELPRTDSSWLQAEGIEPGSPFLISPDFNYDVELNEYLTKQLVGMAPKTREAIARDLASFLTFLSQSRAGRSWRDANEDDHRAYLIWRRRDPAGPQVQGTTWDREVATVNQFYWWAVRKGHVAEHPIPQRVVHHPPIGGFSRRQKEGLRPATYSHVGPSESVSWLPPESYRKWRDVGVRGFGVDGLPAEKFRGRWAARNALYCDFMIRTGLRISEQSALSVLEVPSDAGLVGYQRFWLPNSIAKGNSARWVYVPPSLFSEISSYLRFDRGEVVAAARCAGRYSWRRPWVIEDPTTPVAFRRHDGLVEKLKLKDADAQQRSEMLLDSPTGVEPASLWVGESGMPLSVAAWKWMFRESNDRCRSLGVDVRCHPHALRHSFAVITLEQLQRGHIDALGSLNVDQRRHYVRIFGDPLDWVRRRLGHRSITTTMVYLHALSELEMTTRMALVPSDWDDPSSRVKEEIISGVSPESDIPSDETDLE